MKVDDYLRHNQTIYDLQTSDYKLVVEKYNLPNNMVYNIMENNQYLFDCYDCKLYLKNRKNMCIASLLYYINKNTRMLYLCWIKVEDEYQRRGIGTFLMNYLLVIAYNHNLLTIALENFLDPDRMNFYKNFGFIYTDKTDIDGNPREKDQLGMTKFMLTTSKSYAIRSLYENEKELYILNFTEKYGINKTEQLPKN
jgi:GNAT superfamily N-acetyltransferase